MKIDCPHCGAHGSVDDTLAGKKLRCPKCSKVFLVAEEVLLDMNDSALVRQEVFHDSAMDDEVSVSEEVEPEDLEEAEVEADEEALAEKLEEELEGESLDIEEDSAETGADEDAVTDETTIADDTELEVCSGCQQSFASEFLVEIDSKLYCALCQPGSDDEEAAEDLMAFADDNDDADDESAGGETALGTCDECGESLHPEFLEAVEGKKYCALCLPEDQDDDVEEEFGLEEYYEMKDSSESAQALMAEDEESGDGEVEEDSEYSKVACSVCGDTFHLDFMQEIDSKLYCGVCQPEVIETVSVLSSGDEGEYEEGDDDGTEEELQATDTDFTVGELIKEAWQQTKGAKGSIWAAVMVMYLIVLGISLGGPLVLMQVYGESDPTIAMGPVNSGLQMLSGWFSMLLTGGLMLIGVRQALEQRVSWKMVFAGFSSSKVVSITIATLLQVILVTIGFILLVLPGIYLSVGYALTLPLILDKGLGPWEALEASRKAIHKKWWTVFALYIVMMLLYAVSTIPLGLGLIWTVPMSFVLVGVLYARFFASAASLEEEEVSEEEGAEEEEVEELDEEREESL